MDVFEVIGRIVVWLFIIGAGLFTITMATALIVGIIGSIRERLEGKNDEQK